MHSLQEPLVKMLRQFSEMQVVFSKRRVPKGQVLGADNGDPGHIPRTEGAELAQHVRQ